MKKKNIRHLTATNLYGAVQELLKNDTREYQIGIRAGDYGLRFKVDGLTIEQIPHDFENKNDALCTTHSDMYGYVGYRVKYGDNCVEYYVKSKRENNNGKVYEESKFWHIDMLAEKLWNTAVPGRQSKREFPKSFEGKSDGYVLGVLDYLKHNLQNYDEIKLYKDAIVVGGVRFDTDLLEHNGNVVHDGVDTINNRPAFMLGGAQKGVAINGSTDNINKKVTQICKGIKLAAREQELQKRKKQQRKIWWTQNAIIFVSMIAVQIPGLIRENKLKNENATTKKALELYQRTQGDIDTVSYNAVQNTK